MFKEALEYFAGIVEARDKPTLIEESPDGRTAYYSQRGERFEIARGAKVRDHFVHTLDDLIRFAKPYRKRGDAARVFHSRDAVVLILDDNDRRDRVTFSLDLSDALEILIRADSAPEFTQLEFIRTLRALDVNPATIAIFRRLDFKVVMAAEGEFQHGKDRMGKSIAAEVKGTAEIPEELMISVPVYSNRGERDPVEILCQIDLDAQRSAIHFRPKGDELDIAVETAQASIAARLVEAFDDTSVSYGSP